MECWNQCPGEWIQSAKWKFKIKVSYALCIHRNLRYEMNYYVIYELLFAPWLSPNVALPRKGRNKKWEYGAVAERSHPKGVSTSSRRIGGTHYMSPHSHGLYRAVCVHLYLRKWSLKTSACDTVRGNHPVKRLDPRQPREIADGALCLYSFLLNISL